MNLLLFSPLFFLEFLYRQRIDRLEMCISISVKGFRIRKLNLIKRIDFYVIFLIFHFFMRLTIFEAVSITSSALKNYYYTVCTHACLTHSRRKRNEREEINTINRTQAYDRHVMDARASSKYKHFSFPYNHFCGFEKFTQQLC